MNVKSVTLHLKHLTYKTAHQVHVKLCTPMFFSSRKEAVEAFAKERNPELLHELWT